MHLFVLPVFVKLLIIGLLKLWMSCLQKLSVTGDCYTFTSLDPDNQPWLQLKSLRLLLHTHDSITFLIPHELEWSPSLIFLTSFPLSVSLLQLYVSVCNYIPYSPSFRPWFPFPFSNELPLLYSFLPSLVLWLALSTCTPSTLHCLPLPPPQFLPSSRGEINSPQAWFLPPAHAWMTAPTTWGNTFRKHTHWFILLFTPTWAPGGPSLGVCRWLRHMFCIGERLAGVSAFNNWWWCCCYVCKSQSIAGVKVYRPTTARLVLLYVAATTAALLLALLPVSGVCRSA